MTDDLSRTPPTGTDDVKIDTAPADTDKIKIDTTVPDDTSEVRVDPLSVSTNDEVQILSRPINIGKPSGAGTNTLGAQTGASQVLTDPLSVSTNDEVQILSRAINLGTGSAAATPQGTGGANTPPKP